MHLKKTQIKFIIFAILALAVLAFIFFNSTRPGDESNDISKGVMDYILKIIDPNGVLNTRIVHYIVRKSAHFIEFMVFGVCLCGMAVAVLDETHRLYAALTLLVALFCAVIDEFIQSFTSRTSSPRDVLLDFAGSVTGVLIAFLISFVIRKKQKKKKSETENQ